MLSAEGTNNLARTDSIIAAAFGPGWYPADAPFSRSARYPEYSFGLQTEPSDRNPVYGTVCESLRLLGLDADRFGTTRWNPLCAIVCSGDTVVLKPNFVRDFRETQAGHGDCLVTHGSISAHSSSVISGRAIELRSVTHVNLARW